MLDIFIYLDIYILKLSRIQSPTPYIPSLKNAIICDDILLTLNTYNKILYWFKAYRLLAEFFKQYFIKLFLCYETLFY